MTTRWLYVVLVASGLVGLTSGSQVMAQGTVTWAGGTAPGVVQKNPPAIPNAYIDVKEVVTLVNPNPEGRTRATVSVNYFLSSGGPVQGDSLQHLANGGDYGQLNAAGTAIGPKRFTITAPGTYTIQIVCIYSKPDPNNPMVTITKAVACGGVAIVN